MDPTFDAIFHRILGGPVVRGLGGGVEDEVDVGVVFGEEVFEGFQVADVVGVVLVGGEFGFEAEAVGGVGGVFAEEGGAEVVVDAENLQPLTGQKPHPLSPDQTQRTSDNCNARHEKNMLGGNKKLSGLE